MAGFKSSLAVKYFVAALVPLVVAAQPGAAQTAPVAVPVPMVSGLAGDGIAPLAANACAGAIANTNGSNYGDNCPAGVSGGSLLSSPQGAAVDKYGNVYVADYSDRLVRVVYYGGASVAALITTANSGYAISATRNAPAPVPVVGNVYTIAGFGGTTTLAFTATATDGKYACANYAGTGQPEALNSLGDGCPAASAPVAPRDVTVDSDGNVFVTDYGNDRIRVLCANCAATTMAAQMITLENPGVTPVNGAMYTVAGYSVGYRDAAIGFNNATSAYYSALFRSPTTSVVSSADDVFVADNLNNAVRVLYNGGTAAKNILTAEGYTPQVGYVYTIAGSGCKSAAADGTHTGSSASANSCLTTADSDVAGLGTVPGATVATATTGVGLSVAWAVYLDPNGNVYYTDSGASAGAARVKVIYGGIAAPLTLPNAAYSTLQAGYAYSFAGQGTGTATDVAPNQLALSSAQGVGGDAGGDIFLVDYTTGLFYETYAQSGLTAIIGGGNAIATPVAGAYCNGGSTGPVMTDAFYNGCPLTQTKISSPRGPIVADNSGNLYFGDSVGYLLRKFNSYATFPTTAVGSTSASQPYAFTFLSNATLTGSAFTVSGAAGADFGDGGSDTCTAALVAASGAPGTTCVVNATFSPKVPGQRAGAVQLTSAAGVLGSALVMGTGTGGGLAVDPGTLTTVGNGIAANAVAVDGLGRVYVADATSKSLLRYTAGVAATVASGLNTPSGVAVDGAGDVFFADAGANTITEIPVTGAKFVLSSGVSNPHGLATDGLGNLYVADTGNNRVLEIAAGGTDASVAAFSGLTAPNAVGVDAAGNLYAADTAGVHKLTTAGVESTVATGASIGVAVDAAGDVITAQGTQLVQFSGGVSTSVPLYGSLVAAKGVALDGAGDAFVADSGAAGYLELQRSAGYYKFATSPASTTVYLSSIGTAALTAPGYSTQTDTTDFSLTPATTNPCSGAMASTTNCALTGSFNPKAPGTLTDIATFSSNAVNASPITLTLTGTTAAQVTTASLVIQNATQVYGAVQTLTATVKGTLTNPSDGSFNFFNGATLLGSAPVGGGGVATLNFVPAVGSYASVTATYVPNGFVYQGSTSASGSFSVSTATLTVTATSASKLYGATNPALAYTITGFVNSDTQSAAVSGSPNESTTATTSSSAGSYPITITQGTLAASNYTFTFVNGTLTVTGATAQAITFNALPNVTYGVAPITLGATANSGLSVTYTVSGQASVTGSVLTITGAGSVTVTASQNGNNTYAAATPVLRTFNVAQASLTFTATSTTRVYGSANPTLTYTANGFVGTDSQVTATTGAPAESTTALTSSSVASYPIAISVGTLASTNYTLGFTNGSLSVTAAPLTLTANSASRTYGTANPAFSGTLSGIVNSDALTEMFSTTATTSSPAGTYAIVPSATGTNVANYTQAATNGTLTITQARTTITLGVSPNTGFNGSTTITLTATATSPTTGVPTGSITFFAGSTSVGSGTINSSGVASFSTTSLPVGSDCVTAVYAGDTNFTAVTSSCATATIAAGFGVTAGSTALAFQSNYQEAQTYLTINPGGRTDTLTFACTGLPAKISCAFSPTTLSLSGLTTTQSVQMLVSNSSASAALHGAPATGARLRSVSFAALPCAALLLMFSMRRRRLPMLLMLGLVTLAASAGLSGCGSSPTAIEQSTGSYSFTLTVSSGSTTLQSIPFTLTIP